jgi:hypothetical protein
VRFIRKFGFGPLARASYASPALDTTNSLPIRYRAALHRDNGKHASLANRI